MICYTAIPYNISCGGEVLHVCSKQTFPAILSDTWMARNAHIKHTVDFIP